MVTTIDIGTLIVSTPDVGYGRPRIAGKRFSVEQIATLTKEGLTPQQIKDEYDFLTLAEIHAALAYYYANKEQIEQYMDSINNFFSDFKLLNIHFISADLTANY